MQNTIAVIFDFDETLAPDSTSSFLESFGVDVREFWGQRLQQLLDLAWDPVPAYLHLMIEESASRPAGQRMTRESLQAWGKEIEFFPGATRIFGALRSHLKEISPHVQLEFYVVSSGIGDILRGTRIAKEFTEIWSCDFHFNEGGEIAFPKNVISFTDKTRYIFHISKGLIGPEYRTKPFEVNRRVAPENLRVPLSQMVYVGDGYTDIPCFSLIRNNGGVAIGVYNDESRERWGRAWGFVEDGRVSNLVPADYRKKSALANSLLMAVESIARKCK